MKHLIFIVALLTATGAQADDEAAFTDAVLKCWNMPASVKVTSKFVMSVEIDEKGEPIDITAKEFKEGGVARAVGMSLQRAVVRCAPYNSPAGVYTITVDKSGTGKAYDKRLDPFK